MTRTLDTRPLTEPVDPEAVRAFKREAVAAGRAPASPVLGQLLGLLVGLPVALLVLGNVVGGFTRVVGAMATGEASASRLLPMSISAIAAIGITAIGAAVVVRAVRGVGRGGRWTRWYRLDRFAAANGLLFTPRSHGPGYPGAIFGQGSERTVHEHLRTESGRYIDLGDYSYVTGSGKNRTTHRWGFLAMHLDRKLPHMVLDARANNGLFGSTNLPASFRRDQVLSLEGDFDRHFTLYCPTEYERDALYVFTPDLMALLIDEAAPYDVEIVDDWLFVYRSRGFGSGDPAVYERLFRIVDTVGAKTVRQTVRYADERIGDRSLDVVAAPGRRLRRGVPVVLIVVAGVFVLGWVLQPLLAVLGALAGR
ncbi:hypothetical protein [Homoserinibacter sp. YIM 151385]|uniref:hypothetical protein n=1 Tax=Homoserinibacter sp. YIM 151385 TaxID=2985506 RepID=UPI0022F07F30|nr:hypothetical protein [Homoserinibacter sp. YIM 151385]WBU38395.1 hypothetical protein OF852_02080 [Homoserinibacter sp. YIM 151385]